MVHFLAADSLALTEQALCNRHASVTFRQLLYFLVTLARSNGPKAEGSGSWMENEFYCLKQCEQ